MEQKSVKDIQAYFAAHPELMGGEPTLSFADTSSSFVRPEVTQAKDPYITYASIDYKEGKRAEALEGWKTVTSETHKNEPGTLGYAITTDQGNVNNVKTIEVYASEQYFKDVHVPSKQVAENKERFGDQIRVSIKFAFLKLEAGFLYKS
jgi:quinol monooxygenase YgiN